MANKSLKVKDFGGYETEKPVEELVDGSERGGCLEKVEDLVCVGDMIENFSARIIIEADDFDDNERDNFFDENYYWEQYAGGNIEAFHVLYNHYEKFISREVDNLYFGYRLTQAFFEDLCQEARIVLIKAIRKFDFKRGVSFNTYFRYWIRSATFIYYIRNNRMVHVPTALYFELSKLDKVLSGNSMEEVEDGLLITELGVSNEKLERLKEAYNILSPKTVYLDAVEANADLYDVFEYNHNMFTVGGFRTFERQYEWNVFWQKLEEHLLNTSQSNDVERIMAILKERFFVEGENGQKTMEAIGESYGVSKQRVNNLIHHVLKVIKRSPTLMRILKDLSSD